MELTDKESELLVELLDTWYLESAEDTEENEQMYVSIKRKLGF